MTLWCNGKELTTPQERVSLLQYWMEERESIRRAKEAERPKPWSEDKVFQSTYFCNVRREDDRVTKWIRREYTPHVEDEMFEVNIVFSRLINRIVSLEKMGYIPNAEEFPSVQETLQGWQDAGFTVFGDAYIVSTNGLAMPKAQYVCEYLLPAAYERLGTASGWRQAWGSGPLSRAYTGLVGVRGIGSFMAGQIIADLKNTLGHPLKMSSDWWSWATPGPGSLRGIAWIVYGGTEKKFPPRDFDKALMEIRRELGKQGCKLVDEICNQDLQNCLCEFDKYCRVATGAGRSKRGYNGT